MGPGASRRRHSRAAVTTRATARERRRSSAAQELGAHPGTARAPGRSRTHEQQTTEEALRQAQSELARVSRALTLGHLAASIAHEVNQPLTAIGANASAGLRWLRGRKPRIVEARRNLAAIVRDATRASEVIARLRIMVQRRTNTERRPVNMNDVVRQVVELTHGEILRSSVLLRMNLSTELPLVFGDAVQLQQVMLNLIVNALEAMALIPKRVRTLSIKMGVLDNHVLAEVADSGPGISGDIEKIFMPFYSTRPQGMGLGLAISRTIIEQHGGRLWGESNKARGATFRLELRLHRQGIV
jgi:C4-dicarboxylate-specific signal transduction histidine kinase